MKEILDQLIAADVIVLSTPVYYYSISAQLKTMIDRTLAENSKTKSSISLQLLRMAHTLWNVP